jgi:hypothetical protein
MFNTICDQFNCLATKGPWISVAASATKFKRQGSGKANWGRHEDKVFEVPIDEIHYTDPSYDSVEEILERVYGTDVSASNLDWATVADLSGEDYVAMNEIEDVIRFDWISKYSAEQDEVDDEVDCR